MENKQNKEPKKDKTYVQLTLKNTILIALASGLVGVFLTLGYFLVQQKNIPVNNKTDEITAVYDKLKTTYYKDISDEKLKDGAISGMLKALDDPYSIYLNEDQTKQINQTIQGSEFSGIGVVVTKKNNQVVVDSLVPDSPAQKSNIKPGDVVKAVDGHEILKGDINAASKLIRGKIGTTVKLTLLRNNQQIMVSVKRENIKQSTVRVQKIDTQTSLIQISQFDVNTAKDLKRALKQMEKDHQTKVILDVRSNPGGVMDVAIQSASYFIPNGKNIMQYKTKKKKAEIFKSSKKLNGGYHTKLKAVVLVNNNTASASEIFAAALNESAGVSLVGQKTFGKGTVQEVNAVNNSNEYKYTVAKWLTPNGTWINKKGLKPTKEVPVPAYLNLSGFSDEKELKPNMMGLDVAVLQQYLMALGLMNNHLTGVYDQVTTNAVRSFQTKYKLPVTGKVGPTDKNKLYEAIVEKAVAEDQTMKIAKEELDK